MTGHQIAEFPTPDPIEIVAGPDGAMWFTDDHSNEIGRISLTGTITHFPVRLGVGIGGITVGSDSALWFLENGSSIGIVGRLSMAGTFSEFLLSTPSPGLNELTTGPDGNIWFNESTANKIGRVTPTGQFREFTVPTPSAGLNGITRGPDGNIWFTEIYGNKIGRVTTDGVFTEFLLPNNQSSPYEIISGPDGSLWFTEYSGNRIGRITVLGKITEFNVPSANPGPIYLTVGPDGNIWFTEDRAAQIGVVTLVTLPQLTIPAVASIHGLGGTFFHSDVWITNHSVVSPVSVTLQYFCHAGSNCNGVSRSVTIAPRQSILIQDVVGSFLGATESAGALVVRYDTTVAQVSAYSRVYTPSFPSPTYGTSVPALTASEAQTRVLFAGLGSNGGNLSSGFRSNIGIFNPSSATATITFTLYRSDGAQLGSPSSLTLQGSSGAQINDVFAAAGVPTVVALDAYVIVHSDTPVFPWATVIDNQSGDSVFVPGQSDGAP